MEDRCIEGKNTKRVFSTCDAGVQVKKKDDGTVQQADATLKQSK